MIGLTDDGMRGAEIAAGMVDRYERRWAGRIPAGDVPTSWQGVETLAAMLADLMLYAHTEHLDWQQAVDAAHELYLWDADPMGGARWATNNA